MRKSVVLLCVLMLAFAAFVTFWYSRPVPPPVRVVATDVVHSRAVLPDSQKADASISALTTVTHAGAALQQKLLQVSVVDTSILEQKSADWWSARGCDASGTLQNLGMPTDVLHDKILNNDLTAVNQLADDLIFDPKADGRARAKPILWQAILKGSVCAIANYYFVIADWHRAVTKDVHGRLGVNYTPLVPATPAGKRRGILDAYVWDLVYQMRTGIATTPAIAYSVESAYHFNFRPTPAEFAQACSEAASLYNGLQAAREAAGYGPFDNSPPPIMPGNVAPLFGRESQPRCANLPVPTPQCQPAELHAIGRSGVVHPFKAWVCTSVNSAPND